MDNNSVKLKGVLADMKIINNGISTYLNTGIGDVDKHIDRAINILKDISILKINGDDRKVDMAKIKHISSHTRKDVIDLWKLRTKDKDDMNYRCKIILNLLSEFASLTKGVKE